MSTKSFMTPLFMTPLFMTPLIVLLMIGLVGCSTHHRSKDNLHDNTPPGWEDVNQQVEAARQSMLDVGYRNDPHSQSRLLKFVDEYKGQNDGQEPLLVMAKLENNTSFKIDTTRAFNIIKKAVSDSNIVYIELPYVSLAGLANNDPILYERILEAADKKQLEQKKPILVLLSSIEQRTRNPSADKQLFVVGNNDSDNEKFRSTISLKMSLIDVRTIYISSNDVVAEPIWEFEGEIKTLDGDFQLLVGNFVELRPKKLIKNFLIKHFHHSRNAFGFIVVDMTLDNKSKRNQELGYRFTWYNQEDGIVLPNSLASQEYTLRIPRANFRNIRGVAPRPDAVRFQLTIFDK